MLYISLISAYTIHTLGVFPGDNAAGA